MLIRAPSPVTRAPPPHHTRVLAPRSHPVSWSSFDRILYPPAVAPSADRTHPAGTFLARACRQAYVERRGKIPAADASTAPVGAVLCDALAVGAALVPELVTGSQARPSLCPRGRPARTTYSTYWRTYPPQLVHVDVELDGTHTRGQTVVDFDHAADSGSRDRTVRWVRAARDHREVTARLMKRARARCRLRFAVRANTAARVQVTSINVGALVGLLEETVSTWDEIPVQG